MLKLDKSTAAIVCDKSKAVNKVEVPTGSKSAFFHLTHGSKVPKSGFLYDPAITFTGTVEFTIDGLDDQTGWEFNFLQFATLFAREAKWGGRTDSEGSVYANFAVAPAYPTNPLLDSDTNRDPFFGVNVSQQDVLEESFPKRIKVTRQMGDHPNSKQALVFPNASTHCNNFLAYWRMDLGLTTCLVARDPQKNFHYLAHIKWHLIQEAKFTWQAGTATGVLSNKVLDVDPKFTLGKPTTQNLQTLLTTPKAPYYNDQCQLATDYFGKPNPQKPSYEEFATRDSSIPANFYS